MTVLLTEIQRLSILTSLKNITYRNCQTKTKQLTLTVQDHRRETELSKMDFLKDLYEARMTRNSENVKVLTYTDCCERVYLSLLVLELLQKYSEYKSMAQRYAKKTVATSGYNTFSTIGTDLHNLMFFVVGDKDDVSKLKDPDAAWAMRQQTTLPVMNVNRYLTQLANSQAPTDASSMFLKVEGALRITNSAYKRIRRDLIAYAQLEHQQQQDTVTTLLLACRAKLRSADIIDELEKLAAGKHLETARVTDNEPKISVPDITLRGKDLALYRYIVGAKNLHMTKLFVEQVRQGKATNSQMNQAYLPAVAMLDDIIKGGPAYIQQLRALHKRAKKDQK
jgi:hypothetical protein